MYIEKIMATMVIMFGAAAMIAARRYNNNADSDAGYGIAGWAMFIILCIWVD